MSSRNVLTKKKYNVVESFGGDGITYFCESLDKTRVWNVYWKASDQEVVNVFDENKMLTHVVPVINLLKFIKENFNVH